MTAETLRAVLEGFDERTRTLLERRADAPVHHRGWLMRRTLLVADVIGLLEAFFATEVSMTTFGRSNHDHVPLALEFSVFVLSLPAWVVMAKIYGLYARDEEHADHSTVDDVVGVFHMVTVGTWLFYVFVTLTQLAYPELTKVALFWALAVTLVTASRSGARAFSRRQPAYMQNTLIVGAGNVGQMIALKLLRHPEYRLNLVGFVDDDPMELAENLQHVAVLGSPKYLEEMIELFDIERVVVAFSNDSHQQVLEGIRLLKDRDVQVDIVPRLFETIGPSFGIHAIEGLPLVGLPPLGLPGSSLFLKRGMDMILAMVALVLLLPLFLVIAIAVKLDSRGPVFYNNIVLGRGGRRFGLLKFRTMRHEYCRGPEYGGDMAEEMFQRLMSDPSQRAEYEENYKLRDDPRVTRVGRLLRRTSLDELPQLYRVLAGDMSLVGLRPKTPDEFARYGERGENDLLHLRPGITGYWQINGRSELSYDDRLRLELLYAGSWSIALDLEILAKTARSLFSRRGAF